MYVCCSCRDNTHDWTWNLTWIVRGERARKIVSHRQSYEYAALGRASIAPYLLLPHGLLDELALRVDLVDFSFGLEAVLLDGRVVPTEFPRRGAC